MARTYKRDKNGKFASGSGGGAASARATNRVARTQSTEHGLTRVKGKGRNKTFVTTQRPNSDSSARVMTGTAKAKTTKSGMSYSGQITPYKRGGKVEGGLAGSGSGASGRGKSLRQEVQAKRSIGNNKVQKTRVTGKIVTDMSPKPISGETPGTRRFKPAGNAKFTGQNNVQVRKANANRARRSNEATVVNSRRRGKKK